MLISNDIKKHKHCQICGNRLNVRIKGFPPGTLSFKCFQCQKIFEWAYEKDQNGNSYMIQVPFDAFSRDEDYMLAYSDIYHDFK